MALASQAQADWSAGIWRVRDAPRGAVYDATNCLVDDQGRLFKRGGSSYLSSSDAAHAPNGLADVLVAAGPRTIIWPGDPTTGFEVLNGGTPTGVFTSARVLAFARAASIPGGMAILPLFTGAGIVYYGGSLKTSDGTGLTVTTTDGSRTVTTASSFTTAGVDAGMILTVLGHGSRRVIQSVDSATSLTLREPWDGDSTSASATFTRALLTTPLSSVSDAILAIGFAGRRLLLMTKSRVYLSPIDDPFTFTTSTDFLPVDSEQLIGIQGLGNSALVFGSNGVFQIDNLELALVDDAGNIQVSMARINADIVLWADSGIATYKQGLIVPAIDDVWLMGLGNQEPVSLSGPGKIRSLYRSYVKAGYRPGTAAVHRGHYFLPIVDGTTLVDVLICRLDAGAVWTRWDGGSASTAYAQRIGDTNRTPSLYGINASRVTDLTDCLDPDTSNSQDADGTSVTATVITNDIPTQDGIVAAMTRRARLLFELTEDGTHTAPTVSLAVSSDQDADSYTTLTEKGVVGSTATGGATSDGSRPHWWTVGKRRTRIRFKITTSGAAGSFILRGLELLIRPTGKR